MSQSLKKLGRAKSGTRGAKMMLPTTQEAGELERHRQESVIMKAKIRGVRKVGHECSF